MSRSTQKMATEEAGKLLQKNLNDYESGNMSDREKELYAALCTTVKEIQSLDFTIGQLRKQTSYWREKSKDNENRLKEIQKASRNREAGFSREKILAANKARQEEREKAARKEAAMKEKRAREEARHKALMEEVQNKSAQELEEMEKSLLEKEKEACQAREDARVLKEQLDIANGKIHILETSRNQNSQNSSIPSSAAGLRQQKITNNRQKTGNKPGGVFGHPSTKKAFLSPDWIRILDDSHFAKDPKRYKRQGKRKIKQLIRMEIRFFVEQVEAEVYYDRQLHREVTPEFPAGMHSEMTYDSSVVAFCMFLHTWGNVSYDKTSLFVETLSRGKVKMAKSTLSSFEGRFSSLTESDRAAIAERLLEQPWLHVDGTPVRVNGKLKCVLAVTCPKGTLYTFSEHKGFEASQKTILPYYQGTLIHDGEATFFHYGKTHQCCCEHELRYLLGVAEAEPDHTWAMAMRNHIQEMIHAAHEVIKNGQERMEEEKIRQFFEKYDELIQLGKEEYMASPEIALYSKGPGILRRLEKHQEPMTYFLRHPEVPATNGFAENSLRKVKMSRKQNGGFRSLKAAEDYCDTMSILESTRRSGGNIYDTLQRTMDRGTAAELQMMKKAAEEELW